jgi:hypothetical protein
MSTQHNSTTALTLPVLKKCDPVRLEKAVLGLLDQSLTVTLTHHTESEIRALVKNGDQVAYTVALTAESATCNCGDFTYRKTICKHLIGVCLSASHAARQVPTPRMHHLQWSDGQTVCGDRTSPYAWVYPTWRATMLDWPECCRACADIYRAGYRFHHQVIKESAKNAA